MEIDDVLYALSAERLGFTTRLDARIAGLSPKALRHRLDRRDWTAHGRRVLHRTGTPWTKASPLMRAVLDAGPGAMLSNTTAAAWWGLPGFDLRTIHVTRPRGITGAATTFADVLHEVLDLTWDQVTVLDGIPIVRPERVIFELCGTVHFKRAERALETGWSKGLYSGDSLRETHDVLACRGRTGTTAMREMLDARPPGWIPPATNLEARFHTIATESGLGEFRRQVNLGGEGGWCGRVDFLSSYLPLVVEVQSERYHAALLDRAHDAARRARLEDAGFIVVEVWDRQVWHARDEVVDAVREGERRARTLRHAAATDPSPNLQLIAPLWGPKQLHVPVGGGVGWGGVVGQDQLR